MDLPERKRVRLQNFDYSSPGYYFITICTKNKEHILGEIVVGDGAHDVPQNKVPIQNEIVGTDVLGGPQNQSPIQNEIVGTDVLGGPQNQSPIQNEIVGDGVLGGPQNKVPIQNEIVGTDVLGGPQNQSPIQNEIVGTDVLDVPQNKAPIQNEIVGDGAHNVPYNKLTDVGKIVEKYILSTNRIDCVNVHKYVIMPNHIHLMLSIDNVNEKSEESINGTSRAPSPTTNAIIPHVVSTLKRFVNEEVGENIFQRSYHDHIIRGEKDYEMIWNYIESNPAKWQEDCFYE